MSADVHQLPLPQPENIPARFRAMMSALVQQRNATADEVANLCGDLAEANEEIARLKVRIAELEGPKDQATS